MLEYCHAHGILVEPSLFDHSFLNTALTLVNDGVMRHTRYWMLTLSESAWGAGRAMAPGTPSYYLALRAQVRAFFPDALCLAHGVTTDVFRTAALALANGDGVRIGFEDWWRRPDGEPARSSAELVAWAVRIARACGREPVSPDEARELLFV
jgi:uncharacterized protein (DUF849 family)